jgi:hypothetical protein
VVNALGINVPSGIPQLDGSGKILVSQLPNSVMEYKGTWNAATNTPTLVNGTGNQGDVYLCNVAGTVNFGAGPIAFVVGDQVIYSGTIWQRASGATGTVTSVAVTESGDSLNVTGSPITTSGTINIGFNGNSGQYINGAGNLTTFPSLAGYVTSVTATAPLASSGGTTPDLSIPAASASVDGYLDNADWTTFNNKQNAITLTTTGTSGVSTLIGSTLNIPNYSTDLSGYVPYTGATANVNLGTFDLTADVITGATGSFASNGGSNTFAINHSSGSGIALNITKGGNGEGLYINKTSGSGNAATIIGTLNATTLVKSGGTSSQFLKADGSVDASAYITLASLSAGTGISYNNTTGVITNSAPDQTVSLTAGAGISISGTYPSFTIASTITQYTDALARAALSFVAGSGAYNSTTGVITIPTNNNQITNGSNFITLASLSAGAGISYNNTTGAISSTITQYTDALARAAISLTTTGTSGAATYNSTTGVFNIPQYTTDLSGYLPLTGGTLTGALNGTSASFSSNLSLGTGISGTTATPANINLGSSFSNGFTKDKLKIYLYSLGASERYGFTVGPAADIQYHSEDVHRFYRADVQKLSIGDKNINFNNNTEWSYANLSAIVSNTVSIYGYTGYGGFASNLYFDGSWRYIGTGGAGYFEYDNTGSLTFFSAPTGTAGATVSPTVTYQVKQNGNFLIGNIADAGYKLDVNGTGRFSGNFTIGSDLFLSSGTASIVFNSAANFNTQIYQTGGSLVLYTGATPRLTIASTGAATFSSTIRSNATNGFAVGSIGGYRRIEYGSSAATSFALLTDADGFAGLYAGAATFSSSVTANGVMSLGNDGTYGSTYKTLGLTGNTNGTHRIFAGTADNLYIAAATARGIEFWTDGSSATRMLISSGGNVGIGINNPSRKLQVYGTVSGVFDGILVENGASNAYALYQSKTGNSDLWQFGTWNDNSFRVGTSGIGDFLTITSGGNILIGTTTNGGQRILAVGNSFYFGNNNGATSTPSFITTGLNYSDGATRNKCKIYLYNDGSSEQYGFGVGSSGDVQYHSNGFHRFYISNTLKFEISNSSVTFNSSVSATGGFFDTSDSRLKIVIKDYEQPKGIENVAARMYVKNSRQELGYFAQDLQEILPSAVIEGTDGFLNLSYSQVHTAKIAYLEDKVAQLEELIKSLIK